MLKILVADDEEIIREGLARMLKLDPEVEVVALAEDGELAVELAKEQRPDLLFVDINMPFLNGFGLIEKIGVIMPDAEIIIITGYGEFDYVVKAIRTNVFDYLLKPVRETMLFDCLARVKEKILAKREQSKYLDWAHIQLEKHGKALLSETLLRWLVGTLSFEEVSEQMAYLGLALPEHCGILLAKLSIDKQQVGLGQEWDENLLYFAAENIAAEMFEKFQPILSCKNAQGNIITLSSTDSNGETAWGETGEKLRGIVVRHLPVSMTYVQESAQNLQDIPALYSTICERFHDARGQHKTLLLAKEIINRRFSDSGLSLQSLSNELHVSAQHISRLFRQETDNTFVEYLTRTRIRRAIHLLTSTDLMIYEIAEAVGYSSQHYFTSVFHKVLGISPQEYRKGAHTL